MRWLDIFTGIFAAHGLSQLEHALTFVSRLDEGPLQTTIQNKIVELCMSYFLDHNTALKKIFNIVYNDLGHPPATSIGNAYAWRTADGSYNNIDLPNMGKVRSLHSYDK